MAVSIRLRLLGLALLGPVTGLAVAAGGAYGLSLTLAGSQEIALAGQVLRNHMECDMMHDALRSDVLSALWGEEEASREEALQALVEHSQVFRDNLEQNRRLTNDPKLTSAFAKVEPEMQAYLQSASDLAALSVSDLPGAKAGYPKFLEAFEKLEGEMAALSDSVEGSAATSVENSNAAGTSAYLTMGLTLAASALAIGCLGAFAARSVSNRIASLRIRLEAIAEGEGDLATRVVTNNNNDEIGSLADAFNRFSRRIHDVIFEATQVTNKVNQGTTSICTNLDSQAGGIAQQATSVEQIAAAIEELSSSVSEIAESSNAASQAAEAAGTLAQEGQEVVTKTIARLHQVEKLVTAGAERVAELGKRSEQINAIVTSIQEIADQTNLLALNAAIEAARAGEHGRGFAVVADEVRKLAERTTGATREVAEAIKAIQVDTTQANEGMSSGAREMSEVASLAKSAEQSLSRIVEGSRSTATMIQTIASSTAAQRSASDDISKRVVEIKTSADETRQLSTVSNEAAQSLAGSSRSLSSLLNAFVTDRRGRDASSKRVESPNVTCTLGRVIDLSRKGAQIVTKEAVKPKATIRLSLSRGQTTLDRQGTIMWVRPHPQGTAFGIHFTEELPADFNG